MIKIIKESESSDDLIKRVEKALNYRLGPRVISVKVDKAEIVGKSDSGKDIVRVSYTSKVRVPEFTDPETGITYYEDEYEYDTDDFMI